MSATERLLFLELKKPELASLIRFPPSKFRSSPRCAHMGATALNFKTRIIAAPSHVKLQRGRDGGSSPLPLSIRGPDVCAPRWHLASREDRFLSHGENKLKCDASTRLPLIPHFPTCRETTKLPNIAPRAEGEAAPPPSLSTLLTW